MKIIQSMFNLVGNIIQPTVLKTLQTQFSGRIRLYKEQ